MRWGLEPILVHEGPPLVPLGEVPMEVEYSTVLVQEDGTTVEEENSTVVKQAA